LPTAVAERAVEHQRKRSAALELRERAAPVSLAETHADNMSVDVPQGARSQAMPLSDLWQTKQPLIDAPVVPPAPPTSRSGTGAPNKVGDLSAIPLPTGPVLTK
jgi:hypothetical protein